MTKDTNTPLDAVPNMDGESRNVRLRGILVQLDQGMLLGKGGVDWAQQEIDKLYSTPQNTPSVEYIEPTDLETHLIMKFASMMIGKEYPNVGQLVDATKEVLSSLNATPQPTTPVVGDKELRHEIFYQVSAASQKQVNASYTGQTTPIDIATNVDKIMKLHEADKRKNAIEARIDEIILRLKRTIIENGYHFDIGYAEEQVYVMPYDEMLKHGYVSSTDEKRLDQLKSLEANN